MSVPVTDIHGHLLPINRLSVLDASVVLNLDPPNLDVLFAQPMIRIVSQGSCPALVKIHKRFLTSASIFATSSKTVMRATLSLLYSSRRRLHQVNATNVTCLDNLLADMIPPETARVDYPGSLLQR